LGLFFWNGDRSSGSIGTETRKEGKKKGEAEIVKKAMPGREQKKRIFWICVDRCAPVMEV